MGDGVVQMFHLFCPRFWKSNQHLVDALIFRPQLFEGWITLSTGQITIQRISVDKTNNAIRWIVIYPVDSVIHLSNNWSQVAHVFVTLFSIAFWYLNWFDSELLQCSSSIQISLISPIFQPTDISFIVQMFQCLYNVHRVL